MKEKRLREALKRTEILPRPISCKWSRKKVAREKSPLIDKSNYFKHKKLVKQLGALTFTEYDLMAYGI